MAPGGACRSGTSSIVLAQKWVVGNDQRLIALVKTNVLLVRINFLTRPPQVLSTNNFTTIAVSREGWISGEKEVASE